MDMAECNEALVRVIDAMQWSGLWCTVVDELRLITECFSVRTTLTMFGPRQTKLFEIMRMVRHHKPLQPSFIYTVFRWLVPQLWMRFWIVVLDQLCTAIFFKPMNNPWPSPDTASVRTSELEPQNGEGKEV